MPLSLPKLEKLLSLKGFIPCTFFTIDNLCVYIEVLSVIDAELFLLYIPSKYKFTIEKRSSIPVYKIDYIELENTNNIPDDYAGSVDQNDIENIYEEIDLTSSKGDLDLHLEENYKKNIELQEVKKEDFKEVKDIVRQLKRLKFCVQNVRYKICILYKNYLCTIKRDDTIECYIIKKYTFKNYKQLFVSADLELFYEKMDSLVLNMTTIKNGIYNILNKNHFTHTRTFQKLIEEKKEIIYLSQSSYNRKQEYEKYLKEVQEMLNIINLSEKSTLEKIYDIKEKYNQSLNGLHDDIEKSHIINKYNKDLSDIQKLKEDIIKTLFKLKNKKDDTMLNIDKIFFDNNVMVECVIKNFSQLGYLSK
jgi:hypothetical protein